MSCCNCNCTPCTCPTCCPTEIDKTAENINLSGVGVFDSETANVFGFRGVRSTNANLTAVYNATFKTIDLTVDPASFQGTQTFDNAASRGNAIPDFIGQLGVQEDTLIEYTATGLTAGDWALTITNGQPLDADLTAIAAVAANGFYARTGAGTAAARTITGDASLQVTDGNGVAGGPALTVLEAGLDKNLLGGAVLSIANGGTGTTTGTSATFGTAYTSKIASYVMGTTDCTVFIDTTAGIATITLPSALTHQGRIFRVKRTDSSGNDATVDSAAGLVETAASVLLTNLQGAQFQSDGTDWWMTTKKV